MKSHWFTRLGALTVLAVATACSDLVPTAPTAPESSRVTTMSSLQADEVSIRDEADGTLYTLSTSRSEIRFSDGRIMALTPEQTAKAAATFQATLATDGMVSTFRAADDSKDCSQLPPDDPRCVQPFSSFPVNPLPEISSSFDAQPFWGEDMCTRILNDILPKTMTYGAERTTWLKEIAAMAGGEVINGVKKFALPPGSSVAIAFDLATAKHLRNHITIGFLTALWRDYACHGKNIVGGPIQLYNASGSNFDGSVVVLHCWEDNAWVELSDMWYPVRVRFCEYRTV